MESEARRGRRTLTIRSHLLLLAVAAVLPVLAFALFASVVLVEHDREMQQEGALHRARAMMTAVDAELRGATATLQALAASRTLDNDDLVSFHGAARRVLSSQPTWLNVALSLPSGRQVVNLAAPPGAPLAVADDPASHSRVVRSGAPAVGDVTIDSVLGKPGVPVRVPVVRYDLPVYVLTAVVRPESFAELIAQQHLPDRWVSGIVDGQLRFVARVPRKPARELSSQDFRAAVAHALEADGASTRTGQRDPRGMVEGWYRGLTVEGTDTFTAHATSRYSGWSIGVAIPAPTVDAAARRSALLMAVGALLSVAVAVGASVLVGRRISEPIRSLASAARSLGKGEDVPIPGTPGVREVAEVAAALRDATAAVREREDLLEREKDALRAADAAKNEFLAMLSHELRNPLAAMSSAAHLLKVVDPAGAAAGSARAVVERQARHMTRLIEDLLDVSRITLGKAALEKRRLDLGEAATHLVESWRAAGRLSAQRVELQASPAWIDGDPQRIDQILQNLLENALKFTPASGRIAVVVERENDSAVLRVADEGEGIAPEFLDHVFDLFVQGEHGVDRAKGGMGIGLALVKRLAEMHGGSASVESRGRGFGATFTVRFPAAGRGEAREPAAPARTSAALRRILVIEDNDDAREMLRETLAHSGHQVEGARDGASGLELAARTSPEVALIDIGLPDMDGYEVARRLRASANGAMLLVALTGYGQVEDRRRALEAGFDVHLTKPVETDRLEAALASLRTRGRPQP
jgi:signal transduction histidine kinase/ActR/RegA family two-component response regulator